MEEGRYINLPNMLVTNAATRRAGRVRCSLLHLHAVVALGRGALPAELEEHDYPSPLVSSGDNTLPGSDMTPQKDRREDYGGRMEDRCMAASGVLDVVTEAEGQKVIKIRLSHRDDSMVCEALLATGLSSSQAISDPYGMFS